MNRKLAVGLGLGIAALFVAAGALVFTMPLFSQQTKKINVKLLAPVTEVKVIVAVDKKTIPGQGNEREFSISTDKDEVLITATWEPNNYTKIVRKRKVAAKEGAVIEVDMRSQTVKEPDDITVIYVPTPDDVVEEMCKLGKVTKDDVVFDLGCGDGRMVITAVKTFNAKRGVGVDIDPVRVKESKENAKKAGVDEKLSFRVGDVLKIDDQSDATVVLLYMGDDINQRLRPVLKKTLKPGSRIVSHRFLMGDWKPDTTLKYKGTNGYDYELHLWVITKEHNLEKAP